MKHNPDLLRQLALRFRHDSNVRIVVVSEGPGADYLARHKVADGLSNLILLPFQAYHMVPDMLAASEVLIAVLEPEAGIFSVPSKVLTYHCAQRPILGAIPRENLAARIITEQNSGICVDPRDPVAFVNAASVFRNRPKECRERADRGRAYAIREFDLNRIADRFEEVFSLARVQN